MNNVNTKYCIFPENKLLWNIILKLYFLDDSFLNYCIPFGNHIRIFFKKDSLNLFIILILFSGHFGYNFFKINSYHLFQFLPCGNISRYLLGFFFGSLSSLLSTRSRIELSCSYICDLHLILVCWISMNWTLANKNPFKSLRPLF